jgi:hypothetical protein
VLAKSALYRMLALTEIVAQEEHVSVFRRFDMMRYWHQEQGMSVESFITADGLHLNDWGYACFARTLSEAMADSITRGQAMAIATPLR